MFRLDDRNVLYSDVYGQVLDRKKTTYCVEKLENHMKPDFSQNAFFPKVRFNFSA